VVIGAGVIGLAIARALAAVGRPPLVLEAGSSFGTGVSSRNSEVIHAGLYYPPGSLKARLCIAGRESLYAYCDARGIGHRRCGKLIVACTEGELEGLTRIAATGDALGVPLEPLAAGQAQRLEPQLACRAALHSPCTGIVDAHALMLALLGDAESAGAQLVCSAEVTALRLAGRLIELEVNAREHLAARLVINCAGLAAPELARRIEGFPAAHVPRRFLAKGSYFGLRGRSPFSRLVYPMPEPGGLGIHLTLDLAGRARFGPDVEWVQDQDLGVDARRASAFYGAIRRYWPALPDGALQAAYAGLRPKLSGPGEPAADFRIEGPAVHGAPLVNLFGMESPGLTASLAIAAHVAQTVREQCSG